MRPHYIRFPLKESDRVPLLGDCCDPWTACLNATNGVPQNLQEPEDGVDRGVATYCIDRHRMAVNVAFLDGHAARVRLADLWTLKWSETFKPQQVTVPRP
jgi:prepilin-type processing-associated H-X9-DG protein